jgi:hypothetical protein
MTPDVTPLKYVAIALPEVTVGFQEQDKPFDL